MSPDKVHTVAMMAWQHKLDFFKANEPGPTQPTDASFVAGALKMYDEASRQVRASGPTSKEVQCQWEQPIYCGEPTCPKHGNG